jgi:hypothetical protein
VECGGLLSEERVEHRLVPIYLRGDEGGVCDRVSDVLGSGISCEGELTPVEDVMGLPPVGEVDLISEWSRHSLDGERAVSQYLQLWGQSVSEKIT